MAANASRQPVRAVVGAVAALALVAAAGVLVVDDDGGDGDGWKPVDYLGLRIEVPEGFVVQDIEGKVNGELACPDADGFVFAGPPGAAYFEPRCDPPGEETVVHVVHMPRRGEHSGRRGRVNGLDYRHVSRTSVEFSDLPVLVGVDGPGDKALFDAILASARRSPSRGVATPTTAAVRAT